jgi:hypothetical protein
MQRGPWLDAPGTLHHVIVRGIDQGRIIRDDTDRKTFINRMGLLAIGSGTVIYAFAPIRLYTFPRIFTHILSKCKRTYLTLTIAG